PEQKARRIEVARTRGIDELGDWYGRHRHVARALDYYRPLLAPRHGSNGALRAYRSAGFFEGGSRIEGEQLPFIGKNDIDTVADESAEAVAMPVHAKGIGKRKSNPGAGRVGHIRSGMKGGARVHGIEQISFEIEDLAALNCSAVKIAFGEFGGCAEVGVHG